MNVREWALPVYTILIQLAVGAVFVLWVIRALAMRKFDPGEIDRITRNPIMVIFFTVLVAMVGSHFHLSKPFHSFYAVLNFSTSWLSREVFFTMIFFLLLLALWLLSQYKKEKRFLITLCGWAAIFFGFITVYAMARIYMLPTQVAWNSSLVVISFLISTILMGAITIACLFMLDLKFSEIQKEDDIDTRVQVTKDSLIGLVLLTFFGALASIAVTFYQIFLLGQGNAISLTSLQLLLGLYYPVLILRLICIIIAPLWMSLGIYQMRKSGFAPQGLMIPIYLSSLLVLIGEIIGRFLFYATHIRLGV